MSTISFLKQYVLRHLDCMQFIYFHVKKFMVGAIFIFIVTEMKYYSNEIIFDATHKFFIWTNEICKSQRKHPNHYILTLFSWWLNKQNRNCLLLNVLVIMIMDVSFYCIFFEFVGTRTIFIISIFWAFAIAFLSQCQSF